MIRQIIKEQLLLERKISEIRANLTIVYELRHDVSGHSEKRKWRHVGSGEDRIYDYDISKLVEKAKDDITQYIVSEEIVDSTRFIVSDTKSPYLNLIIEPKMKSPYIWDLVVITVMNKQDFNIGRGQLQIFVE